MKKLLLVAMMMVASASLKGEALSFLYWMIDTEDGTSAAFATENTLVKVLAYNEAGGEDSLTLYYGNGNMSTLDDVHTMEYGDATAGAPLVAALAGTGNNAWSYVVELFNDGVKVAKSDSITFTAAALNDYISYVTTEGGIFPVGEYWMVGNFTAVPEPSSALLFLLGCAALCLRRQRRSDALAA